MLNASLCEFACFAFTFRLTTSSSNSALNSFRSSSDSWYHQFLLDDSLETDQLSLLRGTKIIQTNIVIGLKDLTQRKLLTLRALLLNLLYIFVTFRTNVLFRVGEAGFSDFAVVLMHVRALRWGAKRTGCLRCVIGAVEHAILLVAVIKRRIDRSFYSLMEEHEAAIRRIVKALLHWDRLCEAKLSRLAIAIFIAIHIELLHHIIRLIEMILGGEFVHFSCRYCVEGLLCLLIYY